MENTADKTPTKKRPLPLRGFLKLAGGTGLVFAAEEVGKLFGMDLLPSLKAPSAVTASLVEVNLGAYKPERLDEIPTLEHLKLSIERSSGALPELSSYAVMINDARRTTEPAAKAQSEAAPDVFPPASLAKLLVCAEALKRRGTGKVPLLTPDLSEAILRRSDDDKLLELVRRFPAAQADHPLPAEKIIRQILTESGVRPKNLQGDLPLRLSLREMFNYLQNLRLPDIMKTALRQRPQDANRNYGTAKVLLDILPENLPAYFKIGLIENPDAPGEFVTSYYFQIADALKAVGYASGKSRLDTHRQMLQTAARIAKYAVAEQ